MVWRFEAGYEVSDAGRDQLSEDARVTAEKLNELQEKLDKGQPLDPGLCATLIAEVWRLKTVIAGKTMEARTARDEGRELQASLDGARAENDRRTGT